MGQIVIQRATKLAYEREVSVYIDAKLYRVDPEACVSGAIGSRISREGCIISMAEGFRLAGHTVLTSNGGLLSHFMQGPFPPKLVYKLFGLAWIRGWWPCLERQLVYIRPELRLKVLEYTAQYYIDKQWIDQIRLQVP
jgi:hypothetical protein